MIRLRRLVAQNFKQLQAVDLALPRQARVLVRGSNESGKSTLFEAVYFGLFGRPLVTETSSARLDDVIHYGADQAWVALTLELAGGRTLEVTRQVRRGARANQWESYLTGPDGVVETIRANSAVNERIAAELRLDGETLLNTCFVEQKKLEKLEELGKRDREEGLKRLLNLDRLVALERQLKVRPEEREQVSRLADRAELARRAAELPRLEASLTAATEAIRRHALHAELVELGALLAALAALAARHAQAQTREAALAERLAEVERLAAGLGRLAEAEVAAQRGDEADLRRGGLAGERAAAEAARDVTLPAVMARGQALRRLQQRLALADAVAVEARGLAAEVAELDSQLAAAEAGRASLNEVRQALVAVRAETHDAEVTLAELAADVKAFDVREALTAWAAAAAALETTPGAESAAAPAQAAGVRRGRRELALIVGLGLLLSAGAWLLASGVLAWLVTLAVVATLALRGAGQLRRERALVAEVARLEGAAGQRAADRVVLESRLEQAAARLAVLNVVRPANAERAARAIAELDLRLAGRERDAVEQALEGRRRSTAVAEARLQGLVAREAELRATVGQVDAAALGRQRDARAARAERLASFGSRLAPRLAAAAAALEVALDGALLEGELGVLRAEHKALGQLVARVPELAAAEAEQAAAAARYRAVAAAAWALLPPVGGLPAWPADDLAADWVQAASALQAAFDATGGEAVRAQAAETARESARLAGERTSRERELAGRYGKVRTLSAGLTEPVALPDQPESGAIQAAALALGASLVGDAAAIAAERDTLAGEVNLVRHEVARLERRLGVPGAELDPEAEATAWAAAARALEVRTRGVQIAEWAGQSVIERVLPSTVEHMRRLLPGLTDGRYFDAQLTDDYRIAVLDERAGTWKQKNIFSGGTKDQLSLALRLAFALATLPEERGAAPSFLFLDEPLGAFDDSRARALIDLITSGEVADSFDQIFLISHVPVDETRFDYHVTLADGRVVETSLPPPVDTLTLAPSVALT